MLFLLYNPSSSVTQPNESYGVFFFACNEFRILGWIIAAVLFSFHCDFLYRSLGWFSWNKFLCIRWSTVLSLEVFRFSRKQVNGRSLRWIIQITKSKWNKLYWSSLSRTSEYKRGVKNSINIAFYSLNNTFSTLLADLSVCFWYSLGRHLSLPTPQVGGTRWL